MYTHTFVKTDDKNIDHHFEKTHKFNRYKHVHNIVMIIILILTNEIT